MYNIISNLSINVNFGFYEQNLYLYPMQDSTFKNTMTLEDAQRLVGPLSFNLMIKPAGSSCNLGCSYCYYLDKADIYGRKEPVMSEAMLKLVIRSYMETCQTPEVVFNWHGGEPLILGKEFFRKVIAFEREFGEGRKILNTVQTNGTLLDAEWAGLLAEGGFLTGISIDGPAHIHDRYRMDRKGSPTFDKVIAGIEYLKKGGAEFNTMSTINRASEGQGKEVYSFLKEIGSRYMQFMPVVEHILNGRIVPPQTSGASLAEWSVSDTGFGQFMCDIFDEWIRQDVGNYFVGHFDATLARWCGVQPGTCAYAETCGGNAVIEHNGDVYMCDHFVYPEYRLGNIQDKSLREMLTSEQMIRFGISKRNGLPHKCQRCKWLPLCNGECPKHRFSMAENDLPGLNALCRGYERLYSHTAPYMLRMRQLIIEKRPPADIMNEI